MQYGESLDSEFPDEYSGTQSYSLGSQHLETVSDDSGSRNSGGNGHEGITPV